RGVTGWPAYPRSRYVSRRGESIWHKANFRRHLVEVHFEVRNPPSQRPIQLLLPSDEVAPHAQGSNSIGLELAHHRGSLSPCADGLQQRTLLNLVPQCRRHYLTGEVLRRMRNTMS